MQKNRAQILRSIDKRANGSQVTLLIVMFLVILLGAMSGFYMMQNEKLEEERDALMFKIEERQSEQDALIDELLQTIEALEAENKEKEQRLQDIKDIQDDVRKIREILGGARVIEGATITAYSPLDPAAIPGMCFSGDPNVTASGEPPIPGET